MGHTVGWQSFERGLAWRALHFSTPEGVRNEVARLAKMFGRTESAVRAAGKRYALECDDPVEALERDMMGFGEGVAADVLRMGLEQHDLTPREVAELISALDEEETELAMVLAALEDAGAPVMRESDGVMQRVPTEAWVNKHCSDRAHRKVLLGHSECPDCYAPVTLTMGRLAKAVANNASYNKRFPNRPPRKLMALWRCGDCSEFVKLQREKEAMHEKLLTRASSGAIAQAAALRKKQASVISEKMTASAAERDSRDKRLREELDTLEKIRSLIDKDPAEALIQLRNINQ